MLQPSHALTHVIAKSLYARCTSIEEWLQHNPYHDTLPFYSSVDIRRSHEQIAVVDTNLFPGGFNNLRYEHTNTYYAQLMQQNFSQHGLSNVKKILLIPENHTRNLFYQQNIQALVALLKQGAYEVSVAHLPAASSEPEAANREYLTQTDGYIHQEDFYPDVILLNNDLSDGLPDALTHCQQTVLPSPFLGWSHRKKETHFHYLDGLLDEFCTVFDLPTEMFKLEHKVISSLNLHNADSYTQLAEATTTLLSRIRKKHPHHKPYVVLKSNSGTYGLGVICIEDPQELLSLNRKNRKKLNSHKGGHTVTEILIQEGIETIDSYEGHTAEPVIYMLNQGVLSGFYRCNTRKHARDNLNAVGASFHDFPLYRRALSVPPPYHADDFLSAEHYLFSVVARIAALASAREYAHAQDTMSCQKVVCS